MATEKSTALAKLDMPSAPIKSIEALHEAYRQATAQANLITPVQHFDYIPEMHRISMRAVVIDPGGRDVYKPSFCGPEERAPGKTMILKLLQAAGGSVVHSRRVDDGHTQYLATFQARIRVPQLDGSLMEFEATKTVDLRDGSPQAANMSAAQLKQARQFVAENAETKALLRSVRGGLALPQKYTVAELSRPFVVPALVADVDTSDPEIRRMVAAKALGITAQIYGQVEPRAALPPASAVITLDPGDNRPGPKVEEPPDDLTGDDAEMFGAPEPVASDPPPPEFLCQCPCGHQIEVTKEVADATKHGAGSVRCAACYPWHPHYKLAAHAEIRDMELPAFSKLDGMKAAAEHKQYMERRAAEKKGGAK